LFHQIIQQKFSPWEGSSRCIGVIYSPLIKKTQRIYDGYFHTADILPTLASAAGIQIGPVEGFNQWNSLVNDVASPRNEIVLSLDPVLRFASIISENWKLVNGTTINGLYDGYLGDIEELSINANVYADEILKSKVGKALKKQKLTKEKVLSLRSSAKISCNEANNPITNCDPLMAPCLFNIINDPCERNNLAETIPGVLNDLLIKMNFYLQNAAAVRRTFVSDPKCDPSFFNNTWSWWISDSEQ
jgi:arylsulfatase B